VAFSPAHAAAQVAQAAFEARGREVEAHRDSLQRRIDRLRSDLLDSLRTAAPDLISRLDPASPPVAQGYQLLPRLIADAPQPTDTIRRASLYSWPWTDTLIARGSRSVDQLTALLRAGRKDRALYDRLVESFNRVAADRRLIDAHVEHNWFWQRAITADSVRFSRASTMIDSLLRGGAARAPPVPAIPRVRMSLDDSGPGPTTIRIPLVTDIQDTVFVRAAQSTIEGLWSDTGHRIVLDVRFITPRELYCPGSDSTCAPPARGSAIDLPAHVAHFPADLAVLTTGGTQPHVIGGRSLILGPRDLSRRTLGHEFGHLLGFDDAYLRGYRSLGPDGYAIVELIPDRNDIMAASGFGSVQPRHFQQLVSNLRSDRAMKAGLQAFYERKDPRTAVGLFTEALSNRPDHYGATFQLAKALDQSGDSAAANPVWRRMLDMARAAGDSSSAAIAASRLRVP
jgi:hypothetical protein